MSRFITVLPYQIPQLWDAIKWAVLHSFKLATPDLLLAYQYILRGLLSGKIQCIVTLNEERVLLQIMLIRVETNTLTSLKTLNIISLYSFQKIQENDKRPSFDLIMALATKYQCKQVTCESSLPLLWSYYEAMGMMEECRKYSISVEGDA